MIAAVLIAFLVKGVVAVYVWADKLGAIGYQATLHVRALEGKPLTPAEDSLQRGAMIASARFAMGLPVIGCLLVLGWPNASLPRGGKFDGAETFRQQVRQVCFHASLPDLMIAVIALLYWGYTALAR